MGLLDDAIKATQQGTSSLPQSTRPPIQIPQPLVNPATDQRQTEYAMVGDTPVTLHGVSQEQLNAAVSPAPSAGGSLLDQAMAATAPRQEQTQQPTPNSVYRATDEESTPEGHAAAVARREAQHPIITAIGKGSGEALGDIWDTVKGMVQHPVDNAGGLIGSSAQAYEHIKEGIPILHAYEDARGQGKGVIESLSAANDKAREIHEAHDALKQRIEEFKKNPGQASVRAIGNAATIAATIYDGGKLNPANLETGLPKLAAPIEAAEMEAAPKTEPGLVKQIVQGKKVAQPGAQTAIREGVQASQATGTADESVAANIQNQPLVKGHNTVLDEHLSALKERESDAYQKLDEAAGFDLKAEKASLANDQYKLKQLGNTDADLTQKGNLIDSINDAEQRISDAEAKIKEAGIDPASADTIHKQRMAGQDFKKSLVRNTNPQDGSVNIEGLLKDAKNLRFNKYGDRLEQFFGSTEAADNYMSKLIDAQKLGVHAVTARWVAGILGGLVLGGGTVSKVAHIAAMVP